MRNKHLQAFTYNGMSLFINSILILLCGYLAHLVLSSDWGLKAANDAMLLNNNIVEWLSYYLLSPTYELVLGITLGVNQLNSVSRFNDVAISLGLIHVLVVSGYNINLVINLIFRIFQSKYNIFNLFAALFFALIYALLVGLSAPVIRAYIMCSLLLLYSAFGRYRSPLYQLLLSVFFIVGFDVSLIGTLSLQLSYLASFGLIVSFNFLDDLLVQRMSKIPDLFRVDLAATVSAQLFTAPLIFINFGRYSLISVLANMLLLSFIPVLTSLSLLLIFTLLIHPSVCTLLSQFIHSISLIFFLCADLLNQSCLQSYNECV